jgi:hypothetical protein
VIVRAYSSSVNEVYCQCHLFCSFPQPLAADGIFFLNRLALDSRDSSLYYPLDAYDHALAFLPLCRKRFVKPSLICCEQRARQ